MYTTIESSDEQIQALYDKHVKPLLGIKSKIKSSYFSYDEEDEIGFVKLNTTTGKTISYQLRKGTPMFVSFTGFGNLRYDISYPHNANKDLYDILQKYGKQAEENFWKGGQI